MHHGRGDDGSGTSSARGIPRTGERGALAAVIGLFVAGRLFWACGGTTGREGDSLGAGAPDAEADATTTPDARGSVTEDASVVYDTGAFDVDIQYADRPLPDVSAPPEGGPVAADSGLPALPNCPPWIPVDANGNPVSLSMADHFTAGDYTQDGGTVPAADGSVCATNLYFPQFSESCIADNWGGNLESPFPPCSWALDAGNAQAGPGAIMGLSRYTLCMNLYACMQQSGCWDLPNTRECFCGARGANNSDGCGTSPPTPSGPCAQQVQAAFEQVDLGAQSVMNIIQNYTTDYSPGSMPPSYGSTLIAIYQNGLIDVSGDPPMHCFDAGSD